ncbi:MAG: methionyl-tRNA formyltransferase [Bacteroidia bacterium]
MRIVFVGTPDFAVPALEVLLRHRYPVVGVVTAPDRPAGRGLALQESAVKKFASAHELNILQPTNLKSPEFLKELRALNADLQIVIAFRMMPEAMWAMPRLGTFNLHASLLPDYRGAAPINWAIINGEKETGLTTFFLKHEIDTGDILFRERLEIGPEETAGELHDRLMTKGADLVLKTVQAIEGDTLKPTPQHYTGNEKKAPKIFKEDCRIDWGRPLEEVHNFIRGLSPYPTAWTHLEGKMFKIFIARKELADHDLKPGTIATDDKQYLKAAVKGGFINIIEVQLAGKKRMDIGGFLRGYTDRFTRFQ